MGFLICLGMFLVVMLWVKFVVWASKSRSMEKLTGAGYTKEAAQKMVDETYKRAFGILG